MAYSDEDMLMLSGTQHYVFCPRQWALIQIEQLWEDNYLTAHGTTLHQNVDNPYYRMKNNNSILLRRVNLISHELGLYGFSDVVELIPTEDATNSISYKNTKIRYIPMPVEYKRGAPKQDICDIIQLVCQTMCLEEMHSIKIDTAALFYWKTRRRYEVNITETLREEARRIARKMHEIIDCGDLPKPEKAKKCYNCSLKNLCIPEIDDVGNASSYLNKYLYA